MLSNVICSLLGRAKPVIEIRGDNKTRLVSLLLIIAILTSCSPGGNQTQVTPTPTAQSQFPDCEATDTGFCWPTGKMVDDGNWLADSCSWSGNDDYFAGLYHIGTDILGDEGDMVYAITNGKVFRISSGEDSGWPGIKVGENNKGVLVKHKLADGSEFLALYGHIVTSVKEGDVLTAGQAFAEIGPYDISKPHLHFGIRPNTTVPQTNWGRMKCPQPPGPITNANGFVKPIEWITTKSPFGFTAQVPVATFTPSVLGATAISYELPPLNRQDYYSVLQWIKYAMANGDATVFQELVSGDINYVNYIEGGDPTSGQEFLAHLTARISSNARCDYYSFDQGYSAEQNKQVDRLQIWTSGWSPAWEMDQLCYIGCRQLSPPARSAEVGFFLLNERNGWRLNTVWVNKLSRWQLHGSAQLIDCDTVQILSSVSSTSISSNLLPLNQAEYFSVLQWIKYAALNNDISVFEQLIVGNSIQLIDGSNAAVNINKADFIAELSKRLFNKPNCEFFMFEESGRMVIRISNWSPGWGVDGNAIVYLILEMKNNQWVLTSIIYGDYLPSWAQGLERISYDTISLSAGITSDAVCKEARPTRLKIGDFAFISFYPPLNQRVRSGPGTSNSILDVIPVGSAVKILDGPQCADNWVWWKIRVLSSKLEGWTSEGDKDAYWLIPCESRDSCGTR